jgi:PAS domain S-box-containing protein
MIYIRRLGAAPDDTKKDFDAAALVRTHSPGSQALGKGIRFRADGGQRRGRGVRILNLSSPPMPTILRYGIAVLSVAIAIGLDFFLLRHFEAILTPFLFAVAATVWYAGTRPSVLAIVLSVLSLNYFFLRPFFPFSPISYADLVYLTFCTLCALAVGWVSAVRRRAEQELRQAREELETKVVERTANLQRSEGYLAETQKLTHTGSWAWDARSQKVLYCSEEMFRIYGLDPQEHLPTRKNFRQRVHPEDRNRVDERFARVVNERVDSFDEYRVLLPDGTVKHVNSSGHPVLDRNGELIEFIGTATDVTERKRAEEALQESEAKIRRLVDSNIIGTFVWDFEGRILEANDEFLRMVNYDREDLVAGRIRWADLTPPDWRDRNNARIEQQKSSGRFEPFEKEYTRKDGSRVPVLIGGATFEEGGNQGVAFVLDLTGRKRVEEALRESEAKFSEYAATASDWLWEIGPDYKFTLLTDNAFRSNPADRIGTWCWDHALDLETEPEKWRLVWATLDSRKPFHNFVYCSVDGIGSPMYVKVSGKPVFDANGEFRGYRGTGTDVTAIMRAQHAEASLRTVEAEARESEQRYRKAQLELAHANRVATMGQLTSSIAHEVNQPITAAVTYALAARRFLSAEPPNFREVDDVLSLIVKEGNRAGEVVGRIRALIRKAPARKDAVEINDAILEVIALTRTEAANNSVSVRMQLAEGLPRVQGDRVQLQQILLNLIINAIEAMRDVGEEERELLISTRNEPDGVSVEVRDSGPGFAPAALDRVFEAFYTTKPSGLGLGLSICRSIIEAHNGRLWASPNVPRGAIFGFIAPAHTAAAS